MDRRTDLYLEAQKALDSVWFVQSLEKEERTDLTFSLRLYVRSDLFVQVFLGERSGSLYFALIEGGQRIFGIDREGNEWHLHPFGNPQKHEVLTEGLGAKPLLSFLARVEELLLDENLL